MMRKLSHRLREVTAMLEDALGRRVAEEEKPAPRRQSMAAAAASKAPADGHRLVTPDGSAEYVLNREGDTLVGRADPVTGITPDVDLTPLDNQRSTSRRHAKIYRMGGGWYVMEEIGVMNGTFVNDKRVATGTPVALQEGDHLKFGLVQLEFKSGAAQAT
jgi:pSer/pThr/pTyr-binding forkhead associated (FHA) protein